VVGFAGQGQPVGGAEGLAKGAAITLQGDDLRPQGHQRVGTGGDVGISVLDDDGVAESLGELQGLGYGQGDGRGHGGSPSAIRWCGQNCRALYFSPASGLFFMVFCCLWWRILKQQVLTVNYYGRFAMCCLIGFFVGEILALAMAWL